MNFKKIPKSTLKRLPIYLHYLYSLNNLDLVSSRYIANNLNFGEVQVRKDLALECGMGKPKIGYLKNDLIQSIENILKTKQPIKAIIIGSGKLGQALLGFNAFEEYGITICAGFDIDKNIINSFINDKPIIDVKFLEKYIYDNNIKIGIITTNDNSAQKICDRLVKCNILAIWNFTNQILNLPKNIKVKNENMAGSLAILSSLIKEI